MKMDKLKQELTSMKQQIVATALMRNILTVEDLPKYIGKYIDEYGIDSFINYLSMLLGEPKIDSFLTLCEPLIKDKEKIEKRFGIKIITMKDLKNLKRSKR